MQNKAKLGQDGTSGRRRAREGRWRKTNPISAGAGWDGARRMRDARRLCKTNPIRPGRPRMGAGGRPGGECAKRSQFPPLCRSGDRRSQGAKRVKRAQSGRSAAPQRQKCAKQIQFLAGSTPHHSTIPSFQCSRPMPIVRNEAKSQAGTQMSKDRHGRGRNGRRALLRQTKPIGRRGYPEVSSFKRAGPGCEPSGSSKRVCETCLLYTSPRPRD